jgi:recombinational DNA repair protein (RecF pathway)
MTRHKKVDPTQWLLAGILTVLLAAFGYILKLTADVTCAKTQVEMLNTQMSDVARMVGELWRAK